MWQYSFTGTIDGIAGNVDLDLFNGTIEQLMKLGKTEVFSKITVETGMKKSATHGGPNLTVVPPESIVVNTEIKRNGFSYIVYQNFKGWVDSTHLQ